MSRSRRDNKPSGCGGLDTTHRCAKDSSRRELSKPTGFGEQGNVGIDLSAASEKKSGVVEVEESKITCVYTYLYIKYIHV